MRAHLTIVSGNEAIQEPVAVAEVFHKIARKIEDGVLSGRILDANGNTVGHFDVNPEES